MPVRLPPPKWRLRDEEEEAARRLGRAFPQPKQPQGWLRGRLLPAVRAAGRDIQAWRERIPPAPYRWGEVPGWALGTAGWAMEPLQPLIEPVRQFGYGVGAGAIQTGRMAQALWPGGITPSQVQEQRMGVSPYPEEALREVVEQAGLPSWVAPVTGEAITTALLWPTAPADIAAGIRLAGRGVRAVAPGVRGALAEEVGGVALNRLNAAQESLNRLGLGILRKAKPATEATPVSDVVTIAGKRVEASSIKSEALASYRKREAYVNRLVKKVPEPTVAAPRLAPEAVAPAKAVAPVAEVSPQEYATLSRLRQEAGLEGPPPGLRPEVTPGVPVEAAVRPVEAVRPPEAMPRAEVPPVRPVEAAPAEVLPPAARMGVPVGPPTGPPPLVLPRGPRALPPAPEVPAVETLLGEPLARGDPLRLVSQAKRALGRYEDWAEGYAALRQGEFLRLPNPFRYDLETGIIQEGRLKGQNILDVLERPAALAGAERQYAETLGAQFKAGAGLLESAGVKLNKLALESGEQYISHLVQSVKGWTRAGTPIPGRAGRKQWFEQNRVFSLASEGAELGEVRYLYDLPELVATYWRGVGRRLAGQKAMELLMPLAKTRAEILGERLPGLVAEVARTQEINRKAVGLPTLIARATRGEKLPTASVEAVEKAFPGLGLRDAMGVTDATARKVALQGVRAKVPGLQNEARMAYQEARQARAGVMRGAVNYSTGSPNLPALSGRYILDFTKTDGAVIKGQEIARKISQKFGETSFWPLAKVRVVADIGRMAVAAGDDSPALIQLLAHLVPSPMKLVQAVKGRPEALLAAWEGWGRGLWAGINPRSLSQFMTRPDIQALGRRFINSGGILPPSEFFQAAARLPGYFAKIPLAGKPLSWLATQFYGRGQFIFTGTRNIAALKLFKGMEGLATTQEELTNLARFINVSTGVFSFRGLGIPRLVVDAANAFGGFAPRYQLAIASTIAKIGKGGMSTRLALDTLGSLAIGGTLFYMGIGKLIGQEPKLDPRPKSQGGDGADVYTYDIAGQRIGIGSGIMSVYRTAAGIAGDIYAGEYENIPSDVNWWVKSHVAVPTRVIADLITGRSFIGEPIYESPTTFAKWLGGFAEPIWTQAMIEARTGEAKIAAGVSEFFGARTIPENIWDVRDKLRDQYAVIDFSEQTTKTDQRAWDQLDRDQKGQVEKAHKDLAEVTERAQKESERRATGERKLSIEFGQRVERINKAYEDRLALYVSQVRRNDTPQTRKLFRKKLGDEGMKRGALFEELYSDPRMAEVIATSEQRKQERAEKGEMAQGDIDYMRYQLMLNSPDLAELEWQLDLTDYFNLREQKIETFKADIGEERFARVEAIQRTKLEREPLELQLFDDKEVMRPYWALREVFGASLPQSERVIWETYWALQRTDRAQAQLLRPLIAERLSEFGRRQLLWRVENPTVEAALLRWGYVLTPAIEQLPKPGPPRIRMPAGYPRWPSW